MVLSYAKKAVGDKAWTVELVLRVGADLAAVVNKVPNLSGHDKCQLVCQTILKMLDDVEKVERERSVESTEREKTIALLGECRTAVNVALPVSLELMVMASRGKIVLKKVGEGISRFFSWLPSWKWSFGSLFSLCDPCGSAIQETSQVAEMIVKHSTDCLEEMRGLVAKAEALVAEAKALKLEKVTAAGVGLQLPPILESRVVTLPGESVALSEVSAAQS